MVLMMILHISCVYLISGFKKPHELIWSTIYASPRPNLPILRLLVNGWLSLMDSPSKTRSSALENLRHIIVSNWISLKRSLS